MFGLFGPRTHYRRQEDLAWVSGAERNQHLLSYARGVAAAGRTAVLCTFTLAGHTHWRKQLGDGDPQLRLVEAMRITPDELLRWRGAGPPLRLIATEFPVSLAIEEQWLKRLDDTRLAGLEVEFHAALDDPSLVAFVPPTVREMLGRLGLEPGEAIQHRWVSRAIANARARGRS